ncbi:MAG: fumarate hydratase, partial [Candidatus Natronoplasma sp.]
MELNQAEVEDALVKAIQKAVTSVTDETEDALNEAREREEDEGPKVQLDAILENIDVGKGEKRPICQDTGTQTFFLEIGEDFPSIGVLKEAVRNAVKEATASVPLRP